jgi:DNA-binding transcriptional ArsR family regulator
LEDLLAWEDGLPTGVCLQPYWSAPAFISGGARPRPVAVLPLLRSETQGRLLDALLAEPGREWTLRELADHLGVSPATVMREVDRAEQAGIATSRRLGNARLVAANPDSPLIEPLRQLVTATFGVPRVLFEEFAEAPAMVETVRELGCSGQLAPWRS